MTDDLDWHARVAGASGWAEEERPAADEFGLHPWLLSATDLLVPWAPDEAMQGAPDVARRAWDRYFDQPAQPRAAEPEAAAEAWDAESAELVVDCLYRFLHAIERGDIDEIRLCVAAEYHALEHDREIDRDQLCLGLEASIDGWRGEQFRVSLTEIPDVIFHPMGVLIRVTLQIDFWSRPHARMLTELFGRLLWFQEREGRWLLSGMASTN